jgi:hypothetical protein
MLNAHASTHVHVVLGVVPHPPVLFAVNSVCHELVNMCSAVHIGSRVAAGDLSFKFLRSGLSLTGSTCVTRGLTVTAPVMRLLLAGC